MHFKLRAAIAAVFKAKRLELVLACAEGDGGHLHRTRVRPVAALELGAVHADEGALFAETVESESRQQSAAQADRFCTHVAVVSVQAEGVRPTDDDVEGDPNCADR